MNTIVTDQWAELTMVEQDATIKVERTDLPDPHGERRTVYRWTVNTPDGHAAAADLHTGVDSDPGPNAMLVTLLHFMGAAAESYPDGENADLFPPDITEWAYYNSDELSYCADEINQNLTAVKSRVTTYTVMPDAIEHTCWADPDWDGLMKQGCAGCDQAAEHKCTFCGYGHLFTTHNDLAHAENGDPQVPDDPTDEWHDSPHIIEEGAQA